MREAAPSPEALDRAARALDIAAAEAIRRGGMASFTTAPESPGPTSTGVPPEV